MKFLGGLTRERTHQALNVSYGIELGSTGTSLAGDWVKQVGDVSFDFWKPFGDHRLFEVEQRLIAGGVSILKDIPVGELFFGGNQESYFISDQTWQVGSSPYIRSLPANSLYRTSVGAGAQSFFSYNLTAAATAWRKPLLPEELQISEPFCKKLVATEDVPPELQTSKDLCKKLNGQINTATNTLIALNAQEDPRLKDVIATLPALSTRLSALSDAVTHAQANAPSSLQPLFEVCHAAIDASADTIKSTTTGEIGSAYENIEDLLPDGASALAAALTSCDQKLNASLHDPAITQASGNLRASTDQLQKQISHIDNDAAQKASFIKRVIYLVLGEVNIAAISPMAIFDVARIAPVTAGPYAGTHYGVGGGVRFSIVSTLNFTAAYAWNVDRRPGEGPGAFYFSLTTRNLFR